MTKVFLKAKHWQLFLLTWGIPIVSQIILMSSIFASSTSSFSINYFSWFPIIMLLFIGTTFSWYWSIVIGLQSKIPETAKFKITRFKMLFFIPLVYMLFILVFMSVAMGGMYTTSIDSIPGIEGIIAAIIIPLHLFSMFCIFHTMYFVAKTFKTVELQRKLTFSDFGGEFCMIWFFPVGIWILQPKINKMMKG